MQSVTVEDFEKLVTSFQAVAPVIEELTKKVEDVLSENRKLKSMLDTNAFIKHIDKNIIETLYNQKMINRSVQYSILTDEIHLKDIIEYATKVNDNEVLNFWKEAKNE